MARENNVTVDLGSVLMAALQDAVKESKMSQSEILRDALGQYHALRGWEIRERLVKALERSKAPRGRKMGSTTEDEKRIIRQYRVTFDYTGKIHTPAVLACIRRAVKPPAPGEESLTHDDLIELIKVAPKDEFFKDKRPPLNEILTDKMIARLLVLRDQEKIEEGTRSEIHLQEVIKPKARREARELLGSDGFSLAWDKIEAAKSASEVESILAGIRKASTETIDE